MQTEGFEEKANMLTKVRANMLARIKTPLPVSVYAEAYGAPAMSVDMLKVPSDEGLIVHVHLEKAHEEMLFAAKLSAPANPGAELGSYIIPCEPTPDYIRAGEKARRCLTHMAELGAWQRADYSYRFRSGSGLLGVEYCIGSLIKLFGKDVSYYRFSSDSRALAMLRSHVDEHTVRYSCTGPVAFGEYVFTVSWERES